MASKPFDKKCAECNTEFSTGEHRKKFCSEECKIKHHNLKRKTTQKVDRVCVVCGTVFKPMQTRGVGRKWCSEECRLTILRDYKPRKKQKELDRKVKAAEYQRAYTKRNPTKQKNYDLQRYFGITLAQYEQKKLDQNNTCAICGNPEIVVDKKIGRTRELAVDHNHTTMQVRGLLCTRCNQGIGNFQEDLQRLKSAVQYLEKHNELSE